MQSLSDDDLVRRYQQTKDVEAFRELKRRYKGLVFKQLGQWSRASVPTQAQEAEMWLLFADALMSYVPGRSQLSTHLTLRLKRQERFTRRYQNAARISEQNAAKIGAIDHAEAHLKDELQRLPTPAEIGKRVGLSARKVQQIQDQRRGDLFEGLMEENYADLSSSNDRVAQLIEDFAHELSGQELEAYKLLMGVQGTKRLKSKAAIARRMGISQSRLSQIIRSIAVKMEPHIRRAQTIHA